MDVQAFNPVGSNVSIAATTSSQSVALPVTTPATNSVRVFNSSSGVAFVRFTVGASTALLTDTFVGPGGTECFTIPPGVDTFSAILSTGTGNVYAQRGFGL